MSTDNRIIPRVLVVSHNVFSKSGNMGKTLMNMLECLPPDNLAQLYFHSERPTEYCCKRYFRITDSDILKSLFCRKAEYKILTEKDICPDALSSRTDTGLKARLYQFSRRRTPLIYLLRNLIWGWGKWESDALDKWIKDFAPDVIFFASGDYAFPYKIVCRLAERYGLPIVTWCCDDYYINPKSETPLGRYNHRNLLKWADRVVGRSSDIITISDRMARDYSKLFNKNAEVIRIAADKNEFAADARQRNGIAYIGNLGLDRITPLLEIAKALNNAAIPGINKIDVYSGERSEAIRSMLAAAEGIDFHGTVSADEVQRILGKTKYLLYVESFKQDMRRRTAYSLSTKIGEYLQSGACIVACGPAEISSIEYLKANNAACVLDAADCVSAELSELEKNKCKYCEYIENAKNTANTLHNQGENDRRILRILSSAM